MPNRLFPLIRPAYEEEPKLDLATAEAKNNDTLSADLRRQTAFDDQVVNELRTLALDEARIAVLEKSLGDAEPPKSTISQSQAGPTVQSSPPGAVEANPVIAPPPISTILSQPANTGPGNPIAPPAPVPGAPQTPLPPVGESNPAGPLPVAGPTVVSDPSAHPAQRSLGSEKKDEEEEEEAPGARPITIFLAVGVCFIAALCVIGYIVWDQMNSFKGADQISELLNSTNGLTGDEFEAVETTTDSLKDWFLLKNEHFAVPKEFGPTKTIASRVVPFRNANIGEVMAKDDRELLYFLFDPADLGVKLQQGKWEIVEGERLVGAVTTVESTCFVVAFRGKREDMQAYLVKKGLRGKQ
jgi:hypothetical protein